MKTFRLIILILMGVVTFGATMTFSGAITAELQVPLRAGLMALFAALWFFGRGQNALTPYRPVFFAYFAIVAGLTAAYYGLNPITTWLNLGFTPKSSAVAKAVEAGLIAIPVIVLTLLHGEGLGSLQLRQGRLGRGLLLGFGGFLMMAVVTFIPGGPFFKPGVLDVALVMDVAPWVLTFVIANAFMEELLFRGILIERQEALLGPKAALVSTTLVFALAHLRVTYAAQLIFFLAFVFVLGWLWGLLMQKTKGIWGSVLFHAGADVAVILPMYQAMIHH